MSEGNEDITGEADRMGEVVEGGRGPANERPSIPLVKHDTESEEDSVDCEDAGKEEAVWG